MVDESKGDYMELTAEQLADLQAWNAANAELKHQAVLEARLRLKLVTSGIFAKQQGDEGTETVTIQNGWKLKACHKLYYNLSNDEQQTTALAVALGDEAAKRLIRWKPDLVISAYKLLDEQSKKAFDGVLTIKPGMPTLELIPPKANDQT